ncbi:MAG: hypothetical protein LBQ23_01710, partial [Puniceicoccales bacterium]|nr:hypothetical protein [Puniceicoccales bacterium]
MKKFSKNVLAIQVSKVIKFSKAVSKYATKITISLVVQIVARIAQMYRATRGTVGKIVKKLRHSKGILGSAVTNSKKQ